MMMIRRIPATLCRRNLRVSSRLLFSANLNEDNMRQYRKEGSQVDNPPQEWTNYHGKIPVLQTDPNVTATASSSSIDGELYGDQPRVSVLMELTDRVGVLHDVLKYFWKYDINVSRIESRPGQTSQWGAGHPKFDFYVDFHGSVDDPAVQKLMRDLDPLTDKLLVLDEKDVHWFPRHVSELDLIAHRTLDAGVDLESDHPGFKDIVYRSRRGELAQNALQHRWDQPIPQIEYTPEEIATWGAVWDRMEDLWKKYACKEYLVSGRSHFSVDPSRVVTWSSHILYLI
jgi:hypothetical protein